MKNAVNYVRVPSMSVRALLVKEKIMKLDEMNVGKMEVLFRQWGEQLDAVMARTHEAGSTATGEYRKRVEDVLALCKLGISRLAHIREAGSFRWGAFEASMEGLWKKAENAFKRVTKDEPVAATAEPVAPVVVATPADAPAV